MSRQRAGVGVNQKILENLQRRKRRLLSASRTALLCIDFQYFLRAVRSIVWAVIFFGSFLLDKQKK